MSERRQAMRGEVEASGRTFGYGVVERGSELQRHTTDDLDELLYRVAA